MSLNTIAAIGVTALIIGLYIIVQRLDRIIALQLAQQDLQKEQRYWETKQRDTLTHIADLLEVPYGEDLHRRRTELGLPSNPLLCKRASPA